MSRIGTHQKARLTIAELFEHGQHHAAQGVHTRTDGEEAPPPVGSWGSFSFGSFSSLLFSGSSSSSDSADSGCWPLRSLVADVATPAAADHRRGNNMIRPTQRPTPNTSFRHLFLVFGFWFLVFSLPSQTEQSQRVDKAVYGMRCRLGPSGDCRYRTRLTSASTPTNLFGIAAPAFFHFNTNAH